MRVWLVDSAAARAQALLAVFKNAGYQSTWLIDLESLHKNQADGITPAGEDLVLVHNGDVAIWVPISKEIGSTRICVFYFSGSSNLPDEPDWLQRSVGRDSVTVGEWREFVEWFQRGRPLDLPALMRSDDKRLDLSVAMAILCQAYLAVAAATQSNQDVVAQALKRMGWDSAGPVVQQMSADDVESPEWWIAGLGLSQGAALFKTGVPQADDLLGQISGGKAVDSAEMVAHVYLELCDHLAAR